MVFQNQLKLKAEIIEKIRTDHELFGKVSKAGNILPQSLPRALKKHASTLTQKSVLMAISSYLNIPENDLLEPNYSEVKAS